MISFEIHRYYCACADGPSPATRVCHDAGCKAYPFVCDELNCACTEMHKMHHFQPLRGFLGQLTTEPELPQQLMKEDKDVNGLIGTIIAGLERLRDQRKVHIDHHAQTYRKYAGLTQKLLSGEQLEPKEATGDAFFKLLEEMDKFSLMRSPYRYSGEQLQAELREMSSAADTFLANFEKLWKLNQPVAKIGAFKFSEEMKSDNVTIGDKGNKATNSSRDEYDYGLALAGPALPVNSRSRTTFRIKREGVEVCVGVCFKDIVAKNGYSPSSKYICYLDGAEMISSTGIVTSCCNPAKHGRSSGFRFKNSY